MLAMPVSHAGEAPDLADAKSVLNLLFYPLDCDMDGVIDPGEVDEHISQLWLPIDGDRSRTLSPKEYAMTHRTLDAKSDAVLFADADANHDGVVGVDEFRAHVKRMIRLLDTDGDREISRGDAGLKPLPKPIRRRPALANSDTGGS